ncbi:hypothetical protein TruAng_001693 [Truncatella angustata]|nr:hypothetical protein TruAng_001693 [Truncatella angustata]
MPPNSDHLFKGTNEQSKYFLRMEELEDWSELSYQNILLAFEPFLLQRSPQFIQPAILSKGDNDPQDETDVLELLEKSTFRAVIDAVNFTISNFGQLVPGPEVIAGWSRETVVLNPFHGEWHGAKARGGKQGIPDWVIFYRQSQGGSSVNFLVIADGNFKQAIPTDAIVLMMGEGKISSNWKYEDFRAKIDLVYGVRKPTKLRGIRGSEYDTQGTYSKSTAHSKSKELPISDSSSKNTSTRTNILRPTDELSTYCMWSSTKYGFLHTEKELMACMVRSLPGVNGSKVPRAGMKVMNIPWEENFRPERLTPELVLYCLLIASLHDRNRSISETFDDKDLVTWNRVPYSELSALGKLLGRPIYRNRLTGVEREIGELKSLKGNKIITEMEAEFPVTVSWPWGL